MTSAAPAIRKNWSVARHAALPLFLLAAAGLVPAARGEILREVRFADARQGGAPLAPPDSPALQTALQPFLQHDLTPAALDALTTAVLDHYRRHDQPVTEVEAADGAFSAGLLTLRVTTGKLTAVTVNGGPRSTNLATARLWKDRTGQPLLLSSLAESLDFLHRNPLHAATLRLQPGDGPATAEGLLDTSSSRTARLRLDYANDGIPPLSEHRLQAGVELSDPFGLPSWWLLQGGTSDEPQGWQTARGAVRCFLPWEHELDVTGGWTHGEYDTPVGTAATITAAAESWQLGLRYIVPLDRCGSWHPEIGLGVDFRRSNNTLEFGGTSLAGEADTLQAVLEISATRRSAASESGWSLDAVASPGGLTSGNDDEAHNALRAGASASYFLGRASGWHRQFLGHDFSLLAQLNGQWASDPVLPSEELAAGGSHAVRGFDEATALGDSGLWGGLVLEGPHWAPALRASVQPVAFVEAGWTRDEAVDADTTLAGAGLGLRCRWSTHASLAVDYAWRLTEPGGRALVSLRLEF